MFPIVPSHMLTSGRQRGGAGGATSSGVERSGRPMWNVWSGAECKAKDVFKAQMIVPKSESPSESNSTTNVLRACAVSEPIKGGHADVHIAKDTKSREVMQIDVQPVNLGSSSPPIRFSVSSRGLLKCSKAEVKVAEHIWLKQLRLSMDVHSNNTILEASTASEGSSPIRLRVLRNIEAGEELLLWFSEEILALMGIPFLTPANIRGKNSYTCNTCEKSFENPNPLKIHIATSCEQHSQQLLWTRLSASMSLAQRSSSEILRTTIAARPPILYHPWLSSSSPQHLRHQIVQPYQPPSNHHRSAFQPVRGKFKIESVEDSPTRQSPPVSTFALSPPHLTHHHQHMHHVQLHDNLHQLQQAPLHTDMDASVTAAAHLETIVSNMGTSKQGHLCIYCGKLYSRKYGLKIHIRTHTGFKPLKCKYCFRPFGDPSNLNKHVRLHVQGSTIYKCPECDKILVRRRDLQRHIQSRHTASGVVGGEGTVAGCMDDGSSSKISTCSSSSDRSSPLGSDAESSDDDARRSGHHKV